MTKWTELVQLTKRVWHFLHDVPAYRVEQIAKYLEVSEHAVRDAVMRLAARGIVDYDDECRVIFKQSVDPERWDSDDWAFLDDLQAVCAKHGRYLWPMEPGCRSAATLEIFQGDLHKIKEMINKIAHDECLRSRDA